MNVKVKHKQKCEKKGPYENIKGANQSAHPYSLIRAFLRLQNNIQYLAIVSTQLSLCAHNC